MRLPWQPREYERTCDNCGYTWRVAQVGGTDAADFRLHRFGEPASELAGERG